MDLIKFEREMPPYARISFVSVQAKEKYEGMIEKAKMAFIRLEYETVKHGIRQCSTAHVHPKDMIEKTERFAKDGIMFHASAQVGEYTGFANTHPKPVNGKPWFYYGSISKSVEANLMFQQNAHDHAVLGKLLGYPPCCIKAFMENWKNEYTDPVWQQAEATSPTNVKKRSEHNIRLRKDIPYETNTLLRYVGIRAVSHIPCSHDCQRSIDMGKEWLQIGRELGVEGIDELEFFLQLPAEWDALKGIAYISTPIFKIEASSVRCYPKYTVQREGLIVPELSVKGLKFPYNEIGRAV